MSVQAHIGLTDPKSPSNVGAVLRAAGCYGAKSVTYSGARYERAAKFHQDTKSVAQKIPLSSAGCLLDAVPKGAKIVCIELVEGAIPLPEFQHPDNAYYIFGPEDGSLEQHVIDRADAVVYIPTVGCMNLAATTNVVLYDRMAKSSKELLNKELLNNELGNKALANDELIKSSRDTNNKLRV